MTDTSLDELGPVDYVVVEFPAGASNFAGEMAAELLALVDAGTIRVIEILILTKNEDGSLNASKLADVGELPSSKHSRPSGRSCWPSTTSCTSPRACSPEAPPECSSGRTSGPRPFAAAARPVRGTADRPTDGFPFRRSSPPSRPTKR